MGNGGKLRRTWSQRILLGVNALLVVACVAAAAGLYTFKTKLADVETVSIDSPAAAPVEVTEPRNVLIIGTDSAVNLEEDDPVTNGREGENLADVIMVMRIDPEAGTARLLSFPRDSRVAVAPDGDMARINSAIEGLDGPRNLIDTIRRNFGISIDNYVQVDFAGFKDLVEQLGGVPVYFAAPVRDKNTGLFVGEPGCVVLDPDQALAYARARHFQWQDADGNWRYDETGDLGRITRQQDFIKRAMRQASESGLRNPGTAIGIVDAAKQAVTMDETLVVGAILELVNAFRTFNPDQLETKQIPTEGAPRGGIAYQDVLWDETLPLLLPYWGYDANGQLSAGDVIVDVTGSRSDADSLDMVAAGLDAAGFDAESEVSRGSSGDTTISFGDAGFEAALQLAAHLQDVPDLEYDEDLVGPRVLLSVGSEFGGLREQPLAVDDLPPELRIPPRDFAEANPAEVPEGATADDGTDQDGLAGAGEPEVDPAGAGGDDTTTTELPVDQDPAFIQAAEADGAPPGIVPTDPEQAAACR